MVMGNNAVSPYQQVIEKTKSLSFRSQMLAVNIEKKLSHSSRNEVLDPKQTMQTELMRFSSAELHWNHCRQEMSVLGTFAFKS